VRRRAEEGAPRRVRAPGREPGEGPRDGEGGQRRRRRRPRREEKGEIERGADGSEERVMGGKPYVRFIYYKRYIESRWAVGL